MVKGFPYGKWFAIALLAVLATGCSKGPQPYGGARLDDPAPDFRLVDQSGIPIALSDFRGKAVVLVFFDTQCQERCPLTALHLRRTYQALGKGAESVVFLAVNVNARANTVADVAQATEEWRLNEIPTWHFLTGSPEVLEGVWKAYYVGVFTAPGEDGEVIHSAGINLIDQAGRKRWYISPPMEEPVQLSELLTGHIRQLLR